MRKALKYLLPFWPSVLAIIALVFVQVQFELALPDYMSNIVTYGIQYGGITESVPYAINEDTIQSMQYFMDDADYQTLLNNYEKQTDHAITYFGGQEVKDPNAYILKDDTDIEALRSIMQKPFLIVSSLQDEAILQQMNIPSKEVLFEQLDANPEMAIQITTTFDAMLEAYTEDNLEGMERMVIKNEYAKVGLNTEQMQSNYIWKIGLMMLGIAALGSLCAVASSFLSSRASTGAARNMRQDVFNKVESFSNEEFSKFSTASLITRTTNDIQQVQMVLNMALRVVLFAPFMGITSLFKVLRYPSMLFILGWVLAIIVVLLTTTFLVTMPKFRIIQGLVDKLNLVIREQLSGMLVIRAFNNQQFEEARFDEANKDITKVNIFVNRAMASISPAIQFLMSSISILIIWFGAKQIDIGAMHIGDMMAFLQYAMHVLMSFMIVAMIFIMIPRSSVSAKRIFEVLETDISILDPKDPKQLPEENQPITFNDVHFRYPNAEEDVLKNITFTAHPGETIAFIGSTGSGKSTLINLLPRFFDVTKGSIKFGDVDIRDVKQHDLREKIGYVPQKGVLFSGTVESNLKYADENATLEKMEEALTVSQAKEFVDKMPNGIQEPISQGGTNVSGGQKQRLSIARALSKTAQIFIFDDTFSALDYATDAKLRTALNELIEKTKATVFIVAQRISTIRHADQIVVLDNGELVGLGTHDELMKTCDVYQEIARSQLSGKELGE